MRGASAIVAVVVSVSAATALASCRIGYDLAPDDDDLGAGSLGATFGPTGTTGTGGASTTAGGGPSTDGITPFTPEAGGASSDGATGPGGSAGAPSTDGAAGESAAGGTDGTDGAGGTGGNGGSGGSGPVTPLEHCNELRRLREPAILDGELEPGMVLQATTFVGWNGDVDAPPAGNSLSYSAGWYDTGLYFYIEVTDPERNPGDPSDHVWRGDSIEIYVDHDAVYAEPETYDNPGTFQFVVGAPATAGDPGTRADVYAIFELQRSWPNTSWISLPTASGYRVEAFVAAADLGLASWTLAPNDSVGFDLGQNVSFPVGETGEQGNRLGQWFLKIRDPVSGSVTDYPYAASDVFCSATLLAP